MMHTAQLEQIPDELIRPGKRNGLTSLVRYLDNRNLPRPTLLQVEQERKRRGMRRR